MKISHKIIQTEHGEFLLVVADGRWLIKGPADKELPQEEFDALVLGFFGEFYSLELSQKELMG